MRGNNIKQKIILLVLIFCFFIIVAPVFASTYYVDSASGSDSNIGSEASPWQTVSSSLTKIQGGDTLYLKGDFLYYYDYLTTITIPAALSGSAETKTIIANWPNYTASLEVLTMTNVLNVEASNIQISGLNFNKVNLDDTGATAISLASGVNNADILGCTFNYEGFSGIGTTGNNTNISISENYANNMSFSSFYLVGVSGGLVSENVVTTNKASYYGAINLDSCSSVEIKGNYLHDNEAIDIIKTSSGQDILINNNLIVNNSISNSYGVSNDNGVDIKVYNNTIDSGYGGVADTSDTTTSSLIVKNNIFANLNKVFYWSDTSSVASDYNLYHNNSELGDYQSVDYMYLGTWQDGTNQDKHSLDKDPLFQDENNMDFRLQKSSFAIDHGTELSYVIDDYARETRPYGPYYDIGAYEYLQDFSPVKVKNVKASGFTITWKKVKTANNYEIKLLNNKGKKIKLIKKIKTNSYTFTGLNPNKKYQIKIRAKRIRNDLVYFGLYSKKVIINN